MTYKCYVIRVDLTPVRPKYVDMYHVSNALLCQTAGAVQIEHDVYIVRHQGGCRTCAT